MKIVVRRLLDAALCLLAVAGLYGKNALSIEVDDYLAAQTRGIDPCGSRT